MKFCEQCNNILYFIEESNKLYMICKTCGSKEESFEQLIEKTVYKNVNQLNTENINYYRYDPTLSRTKQKICPNIDCISHKDKTLQEVVFYNEPISMILIYICINCNTEWKYS